MKEWYKNRYRRTLMDMHIEDWNEEFLTEFTPEAYLESLKKADVDAPMIYIQSHVGLCYWPTKTGEMHKGFIGREDSMKRLFDLCHANDMDVIAYYSLVYNNWTYDKYPTWRMKNIDGLGSRDTGKRYGLMCPNNREYVDFTKKQIAEFFEYFDFEGIFLDMVFWPFICYCDSCRKRWEEEVGGEMPTVVDWNDKRFQLFQKKREEWLEKYAEEMTKEIKGHNPDCSVEHQYHTAIKMWRFGVTENISKHSDYAGGDLYGGLAQQSFACKQYYNLTNHQPFEYMTSRCYPILSEHTTMKSDDQLELSIMLTYLHHGAALIIDAIDPIGTHNPAVYEKIGKVFGKSKQMEYYIKRGKQISDVGLFFNMQGKMDTAKNKIPIGTPEEFNLQYPHFDATFGAANALRTHQIPYAVLNDWRLELINENLKVLVVADAPNIGKEQLEAIRAYIKNGGKAYISGCSAKELAEEIFHMKITGYTEEKVTYIAPTEIGQDMMLGHFNQKYPLAMFEPAVTAEMEGNADCEILAMITLPYTVPNPIKIWDEVGSNIPGPKFGAEDKRFPFSSIHSNPPGIATDQPAILHTKYGDGEVIWSALPFEKAERMQHRDIFANMIKELLDNQPLIRSNAPEVVEVIVFEDKDNHEKTIGLANIQESFQFIPVKDIEISVKLDAAPKNICLLPSKEIYPFTYENGYATFRVDTLKVAEMFLIEE